MKVNIFLILVIVLLPVAHLKTVVFGVPLYAPEWALLGAIGVSIFTLFREEKQNELGRYDNWSLIGLGLFFLGALFSFFLNPLSLTGLGLVKSWVIFPILFGLLVSRVARQTSHMRETLLFSWFWMLGIVAVRSLFLYFSGELTYDGRLSGDYASPNFLAYFLAPAPLLGLFLLKKSMEQKKRPLRSVCIAVVIILSLATLYLTRSYSVWLALSCASLVFLWYGIALSKAKFRQAAYVMLPVLIAVGFFWLDHGSSKWQDLIHFDERSSLASRVMIWQSATLILREHPVLGIGIGRFQAEYLQYQSFFPPYLEWAVPEPHNFLLALLLSTGLIGSIGFLLFFGRLVFLFFQKQIRERTNQAEYSMIASLWIMFLLYGLVDTPYFKTDLAYSFFLLWGLSWGLVSKKETPSSEGV